MPSSGTYVHVLLLLMLKQLSKIIFSSYAKTFVKDKFCLVTVTVGLSSPGGKVTKTMELKQSLTALRMVNRSDTWAPLDCFGQNTLKTLHFLIACTLESDILVRYTTVPCKTWNIFLNRKSYVNVLWELWKSRHSTLTFYLNHK